MSHDPLNSRSVHFDKLGELLQQVGAMMFLTWARVAVMLIFETMLQAHLDRSSRDSRLTDQRNKTTNQNEQKHL